MKTAIPLLAEIRVASPCPAAWSLMEGDDRSRHCKLCRKNVYNLSEMTTEEAENLIREKEGHLCVRYFQRADGTILTRDCPVGSAAVRRMVFTRAATASALLVSIVALWGRDIRSMVFSSDGIVLGSMATPSPSVMMGSPPASLPEPREIQGDIAPEPEIVGKIMLKVPEPPPSQTMGIVAPPERNIKVEQNPPKLTKH
jgi:hypothetical protein